MSASVGDGAGGAGGVGAIQRNEGGVEKAAKQSVVHYLPFGIKFDGPTDVNSFFRVSAAEKDRPEVLVSHFRGRELKGSVVELPANVSGLCVTPGEDDPRRWEVTGEFNSLTLWQHDLTPDVTVMEDLLNMFQISEALNA